MQPKVVAIRKRTQIAHANRTMFIWVAAVSVLFGFAVVASMFLVQMISFNEKVIKEKNNTIAILKSNNINIVELKEQVRILDTNTTLEAVKAGAGDNALQVILDALPAEANSPALGASLQNKLLNVPGVALDTLNVEPVAGVESLGEDGAASATPILTDGTAAPQTAINFTFSVVGNETDLRTLLQRLERSIRTISITSMKIEKQSSTNLDGTTSEALVLKVSGRAYYEAEKIIELKDMTIKA